MGKCAIKDVDEKDEVHFYSLLSLILSIARFHTYRSTHITAYASTSISQLQGINPVLCIIGVLGNS